MFTDTVTYTDFNGKEQTKTLFFNISKIEGTKLAIDSSEDSFYNKITELSNNIKDNDQDPKEVFDMFLKIIDMSYGEKSEDGQRFVKSEELLENFKNSPAYEAFIFDKVLSGEDPDYMNKFIIAVLPDTGYSEEELLQVAASSLNTIKSASNITEFNTLPGPGTIEK